MVVRHAHHSTNYVCDAETHRDARHSTHVPSEHLNMPIQKIDPELASSRVDAIYPACRASWYRAVKPACRSGASILSARWQTAPAVSKAAQRRWHCAYCSHRSTACWPWSASACS